MDSEGNPKQGTANLSFKIYADTSSTSTLWGPQIFNNVPLVDGFFNVILGTTDSTGRPIKDAFVNASAFLEITDGSSVISPRQQVLSSPYSLRADVADLAVHHSNIIPSGTIISFAGLTSKIPDGWVHCNGESVDVDDRPEFEALYSIIGKNFGGGTGAPNSFNLPDLRGVFIRGLDAGRGFDPNRGYGSYQDDKIKTHTHGIPVIGAGSDGVLGQLSNGYINGNFSALDSLPYEGAAETRPKNMAFHYIIKM